jgi:hypothetical protein
MDLNICALVGLRYHIFSTCPLYPYKLFPWARHSPSYVNGMTPANILFTKADLASHVLRMCPHQWQDQYNLQEKGMTPMDMHSLQTSLDAIERMCTPDKAHAQSGEKASHKNEAGAMWPSTGATKQAHKKVCLRSLASCARNMGVHILRMLPKIAARIRKTGR